MRLIYDFIISNFPILAALEISPAVTAATALWVRHNGHPSQPEIAPSVLRITTREELRAAVNAEIEQFLEDEPSPVVHYSPLHRALRRDPRNHGNAA